MHRGDAVDALILCKVLVYLEPMARYLPNGSSLPFI